MPLRSTAQFTKLAAAILIAGALVSCGGMNAEPPERKKFPMFTDNGNAVDIPLYSLATPDPGSGVPFATGSVDLSTGGAFSSYYSIALPDPGYDSLALSLVNNYKPLALSLLSQWAKQSTGAGFILDLRSSSSNGSRKDYSVQFDGSTVPVVLLWDGHSASRAETFLNSVQQIPGISITTKKQAASNSCF
jgi:hypothetical protein